MQRILIKSGVRTIPETQKSSVSTGTQVVVIPGTWDCVKTLEKNEDYNPQILGYHHPPFLRIFYKN
jgi:hypothetical protein